MAEKFSISEWQILGKNVCLTFATMSDQKRQKTFVKIERFAVISAGLLIRGTNRLSHVKAFVLLAPPNKRSWIEYP